MKKERNSFFSNYTAQNTSYIPSMPQMPMNQPMQPSFNNVEAGYYQSNNVSNYNDIDNRLNKLERVVNRLETRVTNIENTLNTPNPQQSNNSYSNMYML